MIEKWILLLIIITVTFGLYWYTKYALKRSVNRAVKKYIERDFGSINAKIIKIEKLPFQLFAPLKKRGDYDDVPLAPWSDTNLNRKINQTI